MLKWLLSLHPHRMMRQPTTLPGEGAPHFTCAYCRQRIPYTTVPLAAPKKVLTLPVEMAKSPVRMWRRGKLGAGG